MITKEDIMKILNLETADVDTLSGIAKLRRRVEQANALFTHDRLLTATDRLSGENADDPLTVLTEIDSILDDKRDILKNAEIDLKPIAWEDIPDIDRDWLIPNWLPANTVTMFTGQGGAGKSWMTLQLICEIASGFPAFTSLKPTYNQNSENLEPRNLVLATYEDAPAEIKRRIHAIASRVELEWITKEMNVIKSHTHIVDMRGVGSIWGPGMGNHIANTGDLLTAGEELQRICEKKQAKLLVIDPLSGAFGGNENDRTAVYDFISSLRKWGDSTKCAILVIGHLPKTQEGKEAGFSGSTAWEASVRSMWMLAKKTEGDDEYYALSHTKSNYAPIQPHKPLIKSQYGWWELAKNVDAAVEAYKEYQESMNSTQEEDNDDDGIPL